MKITYSENGILVPDTKAYKTMKELCLKGEDISVGSDSLLVALRLLIVEGKVNEKDIIILFEDQELQFDKYGIINPIPEGFMDAGIKMTCDIIRGQSQIRKKEIKYIQ